MKQSRLSTHFPSAKKKNIEFHLSNQKNAEGAKDKLKFNELTSHSIKTKTNEFCSDKLIDFKITQSCNSRKSIGEEQDSTVITDNLEKIEFKIAESTQIQPFASIENKNQNLQNSNNNEDKFKSLNIQEFKYRESLNRLSKKALKRIKVDDEFESSEDHIICLQDIQFAEDLKSIDLQQQVEDQQKENLDDTEENSNNVDRSSSISQDNSSQKKRELKFEEKRSERAISMLSNSTLQIIQKIRSLKEKEVLDTIDEKEELDPKSNQNKTRAPSNNGENVALKEPLPKTQKCVRFETPQKVKSQTEISNLSQETLNIINNIRAKKASENKDKWISDRPNTEKEVKLNNILGGLSMKEKYSELLSEDDNRLVLPAHFKVLMKLMRTCDEAINFSRTRSSKMLKFDDIAASVESVTHRSFTMTHFAQLLTADPSFYIYEWSKMTGSKEYSLFIDVPEKCREETEWINKREKRLKEILTKITAEYHSRFIKQLKIKRPDLRDYLESYDSNQCRCWYHEFEPNNNNHAPQLIPYNLGEKPCVKRSESISDFCKRNRSSQKSDSLSKFSLLQRSIEKAAPNALFTPMVKPKEEKPAVEMINGIPADLFNRIQEKDKINKEEKKKAEEERNSNKSTILKEILLKLIESIKSIYSVKRCNTLFSNALLKELKDTQRGCFIEIADFQDYINHLHKASPKWMKIIIVGNREMIKIDPNYKKSSIKLDIENYKPKN